MKKGFEISRSDLSELYDGKLDYVLRRNPQSHEALQIKLEVTQFKIPNLASVLPLSFNYQSVMEVGCATGDLLAAFPPVATSSNVRKVGFDVSSLNVAAARERYPHIEFLDSDFRDFQGHADIVILSDVLEHVPDDVDFLRRAAELGEIVLINLPLEINWLNKGRKYGIADSSGHLRAYSLEMGFDLVKSAGLKIIEWKRVWPHETVYDAKRRSLRACCLGNSHSGGVAERAIKAVVHHAARTVPMFGRRLYSSNLFLSAKRGM